MTPENVELQFKNVAEMALEKMAKLQRAVFLELSGRIIDKTPVDTGRARGDWNADVDKFTPAPDSGPLKTPIGAGAASQKAMDTVLSATGRHSRGQDLTLSNAVEYIQYLNSGSSKQAPAGMTDSVINDFSAVVSRAAKSV